MSIKLLTFLTLLAFVNAQLNHICECDTEQDEKDHEKLWDLLKKLEKLSADAPEEEKKAYDIVPGSLYDFSCNCEKDRKKREVEVPVEVMGREETREKRNVVRPIDLRCPYGTMWIAQAKTCLPLDSYDADSEEEE